VAITLHIVTENIIRNQTGNLNEQQNYTSDERVRRAAIAAMAARGGAAVGWSHKTNLVGRDLGSYGAHARWRWRRDVGTGRGSGWRGGRGAAPVMDGVEHNDGGPRRRWR
jgi:hypothetical protein